MRPPSRIKSRSHPKNEEVGLRLRTALESSSGLSLPSAAGLKISPSRLASSRHLRSSPLRRTASASDSSRPSVVISVLVRRWCAPLSLDRVSVPRLLRPRYRGPHQGLPGHHYQE